LKIYESKNIRNIGLYSHGGVGKTSLVEAMLYNAKIIDRLGSVDKGNTVCDYDPDEVERRMSISCSLAPFEWKDTKINILDTPGFMDFIGEVVSSLRVVDAGVLLLSAVAGVEVGTEFMWEKIEEKRLPRIIFINGMDKENSNFSQALEKAREFLSPDIMPIQLPIGSADTFKGVVDLINMKALIYSNGEVKVEAIPGDMTDEVESMRNELMEKISENDEELMEKYCEEGTLTDEELKTGLKKAFSQAGITPVICGSAIKNIGVGALVDLFIDIFPSAEIEGFKVTNSKGEEITLSGSPDGPLAALVFKTMADPFVGKLSYFRVYSGIFKPDCSVYNSRRQCEERITKIYFMRGKTQEIAEKVNPGDIGVTAKLQATTTGDTLCMKDNQIILDPIDFPKPVMIQSLKAKSKADEDKMTTSVTRLVEEDPTLHWERNKETRQLLLSGMGELHLTIIADRLKRKFGVNVELEKPLISYRETIKNETTAEGKHKKQSGGRGQFGHVFLKLSPLPKDQHFEFVNKIVGGTIPKEYISPVESGIKEAMANGVLAGYPVIDLRATLYDGSFHEVDSSEMAFKIAGSMALQQGVKNASPIILEPIMKVEVTTPEDFMGDVMGDLNSKRGRIQKMEDRLAGVKVVDAFVPLGEMFGYATTLRSMTQGRASYSMEFDHYEEVPGNVAQEIIQKRGKKTE